MFVATYNPGYQSKRQALKISTQQRLPGISFDYPSIDDETEIVCKASKQCGVSLDIARSRKLASFASKIRALPREKSAASLREGASTRLLVMAAELMCSGLDERLAYQHAIIEPLTQTTEERESLEALLELHGVK